MLLLLLLLFLGEFLNLLFDVSVGIFWISDESPIISPVFLCLGIGVIDRGDNGYRYVNGKFPGLQIETFASFHHGDFEYWNVGLAWLGFDESRDSVQWKRSVVVVALLLRFEMTKLDD